MVQFPCDSDAIDNLPVIRQQMSYDDFRSAFDRINAAAKEYLADQQKFLDQLDET